MRQKQAICYDLINTAHWDDPDKSRKAHQLDLLIEVLCDIRDILKDGLYIAKSQTGCEEQID
jgi:hypothetical protein